MGRRVSYRHTLELAQETESWRSPPPQVNQLSLLTSCKPVGNMMNCCGGLFRIVTRVLQSKDLHSRLSRSSPQKHQWQEAHFLRLFIRKYGKPRNADNMYKAFILFDLFGGWFMHTYGWRHLFNNWLEPLWRKLKRSEWFGEKNKSGADAPGTRCFYFIFRDITITSDV